MIPAILAQRLRPVLPHLICPQCGAAFALTDQSLICQNGHCFDLSRRGYVNLAPSHRQSAEKYDAALFESRGRILADGFYAPVLEAVCGLLEKRFGEAPFLLVDAGCGEGYYTAGIYAALTAAGRQPDMAGTHISKFILRYAARRCREIEFAVASSYRLPLADENVDLLLNCFSPLALEEFRRVLRPGGYFLYVVPAADHLWQLKEVLYDHPYPNEVKETPYEGFTYQSIVPVEDTIHLPCRADIQALYHMTPYCWKTPKEGAERLAQLEKLDCRIAFRIHIFQKKEDSL